MSENQTEETPILRELGKINNELDQIKTTVGQIKEGQTALQTSVASIVTWQKALTAGLGIVIAIVLFLDRAQNARHNEQNDRITRVEERIVSRLETVFANQPTTACQCEKE